MREPAQTLVGELERIVSALPDAVLFPGLGTEGQHRFATAMGVPPPPGLATFLAAHDGGILSPDARLLTIDEAAARVSGSPGLHARVGGGRSACGPLPSGPVGAMRWMPRRRAATANGRSSR